MKCNKYILAAIWTGMFVLCAVLGFLPPQEGANRYLLAGFAVLFFLPPALLLYQLWQDGDRKWLRWVRIVSITVVAATVTLLLMNMMSITLLMVLPMQAALAVGDVLYYLLLVVSTPMVCGQYWGIGMIGWAALMWSCLLAEKDLKRKNG